MKYKSKKYTLLIGCLFLISTSSIAQEKKYSCENIAYEHLEELIGEWTVHTKDRTSPGNYEMNEGKSEISILINGCGIKESYRGTYKKKDYAREVSIVGKDTIGIQVAILDSEHNSFSILNGKIED